MGLIKRLFSNRAVASRPAFEICEPRVLYSAELLPLGSEVAPTDHDALSPREDGSSARSMSDGQRLQEETEATQTRYELIIVDSAVPNREVLIGEAIDAAGQGRDVEVLVLEPGHDGIDQITAALASYRDLDAVHLITHGRAGALIVGNSELDFESVRANIGAIQGWSSAFSAKADLLIYGCDLGASEDGKSLIRSLATLTGADVAASDDRTGATALGGDWELEIKSGVIEAASVFTRSVQVGFNSVLATYTVDNVNDSGAGSLRQALLDANGSAGADSIQFNIAGAGVHTIDLASSLPTITDTVTVDGTTDDSFAANGSRPAIVLDGNNIAENGLLLSGSADGSEIRGLVIRDMNEDAIQLQAGADGVTIAGSYLGGLSADGESAGAAEANVGSGIYVTDSANLVIGGSAPGDRNVISGNDFLGIGLVGSSSLNNQIQGNYIGVEADGRTALGNNEEGIFGLSGSGLIIGGELVGEGNVIASSGKAGIFLFDETGASIQGNKIGTDATGTLDRGNNTSANGVRSGIRLEDTVSAVVGGVSSSQANVIANNTGAGVTITGAAAAANQVLGNRIYANSSIGIDLGDDGVSANDSADGDAGANGLQNYPVLVSAVSADGGTTVSGSLESEPLTSYRVEFFKHSSGAGDPSGFGEGGFYIGSASVTTDGTGNAGFSELLTGVILLAGDSVTATATVDPGGGTFGSSSELSQNVAGAITNSTPTDIVLDTESSAEETVNATTPGDQTQPAIAALPHGGYISVWTSDGQDGSDLGVYGQRFDASGIPVGTEFLVADEVQDNESDPSVSVFDDGGFVVAWQDQLSGVYAWTEARVFHADGSYATPEFTVSPGTDGDGEGYQPAVQTLNDTQFVVIWSNETGGSAYEVSGQIYDRAGATVGASFTVGSLIAENALFGAQPEVSRLEDGGFAVSWRTYDGVSFGSALRVMNSDGSIRSAQIDLGGDHRTDVAGLANGDLVAVYGDANNVKAQIIDTSGNVVVSEFTVNNTTTGIQREPTVIRSDDGFVVAWHSDNGDGSSTAILAQRFDSSGNALGDEVLVNATTNGTQSQPEIAETVSGQVRAVWQSENIDGSGFAVVSQVMATNEASIVENAAAGTVIADVLGVMDLDATDTHTLSLLYDLGGRFAIDASTGVVSVADGSLLDYEVQNAFSLTIVAQDGTGAMYSEALTVNLTSRGGEPALVVPGAQTLTEDQTLVFSSANGNSVTVSDTGAGNTPLQVSLAVDDGILTLSQLAGLTLTAGANGSGSVVVQGSEADLNAALNGLTFTPDADFNGTVSLQVSTSIAADLAGHYTFDAADARDDSAGTLQDGVLGGDAGVTPDGTRGPVLSLDGVSDSVTIAGLYGSSQNVTLAAWVNLATANAEGAEVLSLGDNVALRLDALNTGWGIVGGFRRVGDWTTVPSGQFIAGTGWHHVAFSVDSSNDVQSLYLDGNLIAQANSTDAIVYDQGANTTIGIHGNGGTLRDFDGSIDDARIYTRALTPDEILSLALDNTSQAASVAITVNAVNDAPVLGSSAGGGTRYEGPGGTYFNNALTLADVDSVNFDGGLITTGITNNTEPGDTLIIRDGGGVTVAGSSVLYDDGGGAVVIGSFSGGDSPNPLVIALNSASTVSGVEAVARQVAFRTELDDPSGLQRTLQMTVSDGDGGVSATAIRGMNVVPVNDAPVNASPLSVNVVEDLQSTVPGLSLTDPDDQGNLMRTRLQASAGTLSVTLAGSSTFVAGTNGSADLTLEGNEADLNASLATLTYTGNPNLNGVAADTITVTSDDLGNTGVGIAQQDVDSIQVDISAVNDAPVLDDSASLSLSSQPEDAGPPVGVVGTLVSDLVQLGGNVSDVDTGSQTGVAIISADTSGGSWWFSLDGGANWSAMGLVSESSARVLNANSNTRIFFESDNEFTGTVADAIVFRAWDRSAGPSGSLQDASTTGGDSAYSSVSESASLDVTSVNDSPKLVGPSQIANGQFDTDLAAWTASGNVDSSSGRVRFGQIGGANGTISQTITTTPGQTYFVSFDYGDQSATRSQSLDVTLAGINPLLNVSLQSGVAENTTPGYQFSFEADSNTAVITFADTSVSHSGVRGYLDNVTIATDAQSNPPIIFTENDAAVVVDATLLVQDIDDVNITSAVVGISGNYQDGQDVLGFVAQNGISGSWNPASGQLSLSGSASKDDYQTALRSITYTNLSEAPDTLTRTVSFRVNDGSTDSNTQTRDIALTAVNDAPVNSLPIAVSVAEDIAGAISGVSVADVDNNGASLSVRLQTGSGKINLVLAGATAIDAGALDSADLTISGTESDINATLASLTYTGSANLNGVNADLLTITSNDLGNSGGGGSLQDVDTLPIDIAAVNDAPVHIAPAVFTVAEETATALSGLSVVDVDDLGGTLATTLQVGSGVLTVTLSGGATIGAGSNDSADLTIQGSKTDINNTLASLQYTGAANLTGASADTLGMTTSDLGNSGSGGALLAANAVPIDITPVDDEPAVAINAGASLTEGGTVVIDNTMLRIDDIDSAPADLVLTLSAIPVNGTLRLNGAPLGVGQSFTQDDLNNGRVAYHHNDAELFNDSFGFGFADASSSPAGAATGFSVTIAPINDNDPIIVSNGGGGSVSVTVIENTNAVTTVVASDTDRPPQAMTYALAGGADVGAFSIDPISGDLALTVATDFEAPSDANGDNVYEVIVRVDDGAGRSVTQSISASIVPINELAPVITSDGGGASALLLVPENSVAVTTVVATDEDAPADVLSYQLDGGPDASLFSIDALGGDVRFIGAPDYEFPEDAGSDGRYEVVVVASDGLYTTSQSLSVQVGNVNEAPTDIQPAVLGVSEAARSGALIATLAALDPDANETFVFSLSGPTAALFSVNANTGGLALAAEGQLDHHLTNVHHLTVRVTDSGGLVFDKQITVQVEMAAEVDSGEMPAMTDIQALAPVARTGGTSEQPEAIASPSAKTPATAEPTRRATEGVQTPVDSEENQPGFDGVAGDIKGVSVEAGDQIRIERTRADRGSSSSSELELLELSISFDWLLPEKIQIGKAIDSVSMAPISLTVDFGQADGQWREESLPSSFSEMVTDPVRVAGTLVSVGAVWWLTRSGGLMVTMLMGIPTWRHLDLLPIVSSYSAPEPDEDGERSPSAEDEFVDALFELHQHQSVTAGRDSNG